MAWGLRVFGVVHLLLVLELVAVTVFGIFLVEVEVILEKGDAWADDRLRLREPGSSSAAVDGTGTLARDRNALNMSRMLVLVLAEHSIT